ncbi:hypothetical protein PQX77_015133 [Marasmius sp. AFHP31]|nr:hypothetical protein PQX77_015133 [Marasmius sp. AFHP31]
MPLGGSSCASRYNPRFFSQFQPVIFEVEDELYQVPRIFLPHSGTLETLYPWLKQDFDAEIANVKLKDCSKFLFEAFLMVVFEPVAHLFPTDHPANNTLTLDNLLDAFAVANGCGFHEMARNLENRVSDKLTTPVEKIVYGQKHRILSWFREGLEKLVESEDDITIAGAKAMGFVLSIRIYHARAKYARELSQQPASTTGDRDGPASIVHKVVKEMFIDAGDPWADEYATTSPAFPSILGGDFNTTIQLEREPTQTRSQPADAIELSSQTPRSMISLKDMLSDARGESGLDFEELDIVAMENSTTNSSESSSFKDLGQVDVESMYTKEDLDNATMNDHLDGPSSFQIATPALNSSILRELIEAILHHTSRSTKNILSTVPKVEDELYQLPRLFVPQSERLETSYPCLKQPYGGEIVNVKLKDCSKVLFEAFLTVVLEPVAHLFPTDHPATNSPTLDVLLDAFAVANRYSFHEMARNLEDRVNDKFTTPVEKIIFGTKYRTLSWFREGLEKLVASEEDIAIEDAKTMGLVLALRIYHARARCARELSQQPVSLTGNRDLASMVGKVVEEMFIDGGNPWADVSSTTSSASPIIFEEDSDTTTRGESEHTRADSPGDVIDLDDSQTVRSVISLDDIPSNASETSPLSEDSFDIDIPATPVTSLRAPTQQAYNFNVSPTDRFNPLRELAGAVLHITPRSTPGILSSVPKVCNNKQTTCGGDLRCHLCCLKRWKTYQPYPGALEARTALGQIFLDHTIDMANGHSISEEEVVSRVEKTCLKLPSQCGPSQRCVVCCRKKIETMLRDGHMI